MCHSSSKTESVNRFGFTTTMDIVCVAQQCTEKAPTAGAFSVH